MGIFQIQPQRVPLGSFTSPQGADVKVYIEQPWFRALEALSKVVLPSGNGTGTVSFDAAPAYSFGDVVFTSGATTLRRLPTGEVDWVLFSNGPGVVPSWRALPDTPPAPTPPALSSILFDDTGRILSDNLGLTLTDA